MPRYLPVFLNVSGQPCLIVGAGPIAARKAEQLLHSGAVLTVVAPEASAEILALVKEKGVEYLAREFVPTDLEGRFLVVAATDSRDVNAGVFRAAKERGVPVNVVDDPELCTFIYGSVVERGGLQIAISTSGSAPALAKRLRRQLESIFGEEYSQYLDILAECRAAGKHLHADSRKRQHAFERVLDLDLLSLIRKGHAEEARRRALECMSQSQD